MFCFRKKYFFIALILFLTEVLIALYVRDSFIRPYGGDFLVVILIYTSLRAVLDVSPWKLALATLLFAYTVEVLQYFNIVDKLGLSGNIIAKTAIGYGFEWWDMLAYTLGVAFVLVVESYRTKKDR